jgi:hypothetical protein
LIVKGVSPQIDRNRGKHGDHLSHRKPDSADVPQIEFAASAGTHQQGQRCHHSWCARTQVEGQINIVARQPEILEVLTDLCRDRRVVNWAYQVDFLQIHRITVVTALFL